MPAFKRGLKEEFIKKLNEEYERGGLWRDIVDDKSLFIAIRKKHINVYSNGCSLLELSFKDKDLIYKINYKYLLKPSMPNPKIKFTNGKIENFCYRNFFLDKLDDKSDIEFLKKSSIPYSKPEKTGIHQLLMANKNIIDLKITFSKAATQNGSTKRIDFSTFRYHEGNGEIIFYEVKCFDNNSIRSLDNKEFLVIQQLENYKNLIKNNSEDLKNSYQTICDNLTKLKGMNQRYEVNHFTQMKNIVSKDISLCINKDIRLIIFGFDEDQKNGKIWGAHYKKLKEYLGDNLLSVGNLERFTRGIST